MKKALVCNASYAQTVRVLKLMDSPRRSRWNSIHAGRLGMAALLLILILGTARGAAPALMVNDKMPGLSLQKDFQPMKLRGYGQVAGKYWINASGGSLLEIDCQDSEHARLLQAKYLSDLGEIPPATQTGRIDVGGSGISIQIADGVGVVAALRGGTTVILAAAKDAGGMTQLLTDGLSGDRSGWTSVAEGKVPMFLDRFDKYGFRFYYAPGRLKPGANGRDDPAYDPSEDFDFAQAVHGGLLVWSSALPGETAEGVNEDAGWAWSLAEAKERGLAFGVNLGLSGRASWYYNRYPESLMQYPPGFLGGYYGSMNYGIPNMVSLTSSEGTDAMLGQLQDTVRHFKDVENITSWLEPHEELGGGSADLFVEAGPLSDANYQEYLRQKYQTVQALSQRWYGDATTVTSWDQIRAPEPADFQGWGADAIDLAGTWRVDYASADNPAALANDFDDSTWGEMVAPGHGLARLLVPFKPALWRRHLTLDGAWLAKHPKVWLYVWDMNNTRGAKQDAEKAVVISLNGARLSENSPLDMADHWVGLDATQTLHEGDNVLAIRLPQGVFNYRIYLSGDAPKSYPELGEGKNAQWVDFIDWSENLRIMGVRRGMQMIRQVDPDRGIMLMAPDKYADGIQQDALEYGGDFHNTGYMGGWWCDVLPSLMRGVNLPFSVEPSQGPTLPIHLLGSFGNWITEGCNAIDHFQNLGEVLWNPALKKCFEDHAAMYTSIGRYHSPVAQVAALYSNRCKNLYGFPWVDNPATEMGEPYFRGGGYPSAFNCRGMYAPMEYMPAGSAYESDAVTEMMFERDQVGKYRVVVDTNTSVLDESAIDGIQRYVEAGGVFVTYGETGRHSPEKPDSWPIARLTGFKVTGLKPGAGTIHLAQGQAVFSADWAPKDNLTGLRFTQALPDAQAVLSWNDGTVAVGLRPVGKGYVVTVGPWFNPTIGNEFFSRLFQWLKIDPIPAHFEPAEAKVFWRHFLSNNGLYDIWVVRNVKQTESAQGTLILADGVRPAWMIDLNSGTRTPVNDGRLPVDLPPAEMAIYITPRGDAADSASEWFALQRGWWQGTADPGPVLPKLEAKLSVDLTEGWAFRPVEAQTDVSALVAAAADDASWPQIPLGIFTLPDHREVRHAVLRKHFHVSENWNQGRVLLRLPGFREHGNVYLDGQPLVGAPELVAGSDHVLAIDIQGTGALLGARGPAWMIYHPAPAATQSLAGVWSTSPDAFNWSGTASLPGDLPQGIRTLRATVRIDKAAQGRTIVLHAVEDSLGFQGVVINGNFEKPWVREGPELNINITPWIRLDQENEIILIDAGAKDKVSDISLEFHAPGTYP